MKNNYFHLLGIEKWFRLLRITIALYTIILYSTLNWQIQTTPIPLPPWKRWKMKKTQLLRELNLQIESIIPILLYQKTTPKPTKYTKVINQITIPYTLSLYIYIYTSGRLYSLYHIIKGEKGKRNYKIEKRKKERNHLSPTLFSLLFLFFMVLFAPLRDVWSIQHFQAHPKKMMKSPNTMRFPSQNRTKKKTRK